MSSLRETAEAARDSCVGSQSSLTAYADFWAAATPETVLALLDAVDVLREAVRVLNDEIGWFDASDHGYASFVSFEDYDKQEQVVEAVEAVLARLPEEVRR